MISHIDSINLYNDKTLRVVTYNFQVLVVNRIMTGKTTRYLTASRDTLFLIDAKRDPFAYWTISFSDSTGSCVHRRKKHEKPALYKISAHRSKLVTNRSKVQCLLTLLCEYRERRRNSVGKPIYIRFVEASSGLIRYSRISLFLSNFHHKPIPGTSYSFFS